MTKMTKNGVSTTATLTVNCSAVYALPSTPAALRVTHGWVRK